MIRIIPIAFIILITFSACKTQKLGTSELTVSLPKNYSNFNDSANLAKTKWNNYFTDKNLVSLIEIGLKNNLDLLVANQRIDMARAHVKFAKGSFLPTINAFGSIGQRRFGKYTMDGVGNYDTNLSPNISKDEKIAEHLPDYYMGFQANWEIDVWGKIRNKKKAAVARFLSTVEGRNYVITNLISEISLTYYELLSLDNQLEIIKETITLQDSALSIVILQKQVGDVTELAVKQFEAQLLNTKGIEVELTQSIIEVEAKLNFLLGRFPQAIERDKVNFNIDVKNIINYGLPTQLIENRADVRRAEYELIATKADLKAAKASFFPSLTLSGAYGFQSFNPIFLVLNPQSIAYNFLGGLTAPIFNQNALKANYKNATASQKEALYNYSKTVVNSFVEVNNQISNVDNLQKLYSLKNSETQAYIKAIDVSNELFLKGRASYLEVILTQHNALRTKIDLILTKQKQHYCYVNIYKALGGGWR